MSIANPTAAVYAFGLVRADDVPDAPLRYEPLTSDGIPADSASEPWTESDRAEWLTAEMADARADFGGGW